MHKKSDEWFGIDLAGVFCAAQASQQNNIESNLLLHFEKLHKQNAMTSREKRLQQRLALIYQQIELLRRYPEEFHKALGIQGTVEWLNEILDEINDIRKKLREINEGF